LLIGASAGASGAAAPSAATGAASAVLDFGALSFFCRLAGGAFF